MLQGFRIADYMDKEIPFDEIDDELLTGVYHHIEMHMSLLGELLKARKESGKEFDLPDYAKRMTYKIVEVLQSFKSEGERRGIL